MRSKRDLVTAYGCIYAVEGREFPEGLWKNAQLKGRPLCVSRRLCRLWEDAISYKLDSATCADCKSSLAYADYIIGEDLGLE